MVIHFSEQNFKHYDDDFGYYGAPGLVSPYGTNEILASIYADIEGCFVTDTSTWTDTYKNISFHGAVGLVKDSNDDDAMTGSFIASDNKLYVIRLKGVNTEFNGYWNGVAVHIMIRNF